jgi:hypothetical protein
MAILSYAITGLSTVLVVLQAGMGGPALAGFFACCRGCCGGGVDRGVVSCYPGKNMLKCFWVEGTYKFVSCIRASRLLRWYILSR